MKHLVSRELYGYWDGLRGERAAPERGELDPVAIRAILADTLLLDITQNYPYGGREAIFRLSGTRLNALWGGDLKGRPLVSLWQPDEADAVHHLLTLVLDDQRPVVAGAAGMSADGVQVDIEMLLLPLRHHGKTHVRLLGSIVPQQPLRSLGTHPLGLLSLTSFRCIVERTLLRPSASAFPRSLPGPVRRGRFIIHEGGRQSAQPEGRTINPSKQF